MLSESVISAEQLPGLIAKAAATAERVRNATGAQKRQMVLDTFKDLAVPLGLPIGEMVDALVAFHNSATVTRRACSRWRSLLCSCCEATNSTD